jgi:hypothetical protein
MVMPGTSHCAVMSREFDHRINALISAKRIMNQSLLPGAIFWAYFRPVCELIEHGHAQ